MSSMFTRAARMFTGGRSHLSLRDFIPNSNQSLLHQYQHHQHEVASKANQAAQAQLDAAALGEKNTLNDIDSAYGISPVSADDTSRLAAITKELKADGERRAGEAANRPLAFGRLPMGPDTGPGSLNDFLGGHPERGLAMEGMNIASAMNSPAARAAAANKAKLDSIIGDQRAAVMDTGMHTLDTGFGNALRSQRQRLAAQGLIGGSADAGAQSSLLGDYLGGRQQLASGANQAELAARSGLDDQRMQLKRDVKLGISPDLASIAGMSAQGQAIGSAYRNVADNAIGNLFSDAGNIYGQANLASGYGYQGTDALRLKSPSTSAARGQYT